MYSDDATLQISWRSNEELELSSQRELSYIVYIYKSLAKKLFINVQKPIEYIFLKNITKLFQIL